MDWGLALWLGEMALQFTFVGFLLAKRSRQTSSTNLTWIVIILAIPILGALIYLMLGEVRLGRWRLKRYSDLVQRIRSSPGFYPKEGRYPDLKPGHQSLSELVTSVGESEPRGGNSLKLYPVSDQLIDSLTEDIEGAAHHCHLLFYIFLADGSGRRVCEALERAAGRGVACRLLVDAVGSAPFLDSELRRSLEKSGVQVAAALPASLFRANVERMDLRNHRKLAVIDGRVGYTGSQNIADAAFSPKPRFAPWVDLSVRIEGPVVHDLQNLFVEDWYVDTQEALEDLLELECPMIADGVPAQIMGTGPMSYHEALRQFTQAAFHNARKELILTTPYFVPDEATFAALCTAARRGVHAQVVVPARNDSPLVGPASRSFYEEMLDCGVEIHEFTEGLLHAKTLTVDRDLALVSTANFDRRSFELNFEVSTLVYDTNFARQLRFLQRTYIERSRRIQADRWRRRRWPLRVAQNAAGIFSALL